MKMNGLVALITGGSRGLGKAIAVAYAQEGAHVIVTSSTDSPTGLPGTAEQTAQAISQLGGSAVGIACDVTNEVEVNNAVSRVVEQYGKVDVLVNNAGIMIPCEPFLEIDPQRWDELMLVNTRGPYLTCRAVVPIMIRQRSGSIINIGSNAGAEHRWGGTAYCSSKAALHMFNMCLAEELKEYNIAVNVLSPGGLKSEGSNAIPWAHTNWDQRVEPEDCGPSAVALALHRADTMTGKVLDRATYKQTWS